MNSPILRTLVLSLSLSALTACGGNGKDQGPPEMPPPQVGVLKAEPTNSPLTRDLVGRLSAYRRADVRARVAGVLLERTYDEGTDVKKGQVLFQIDPAPLKAALNAAEASLAQARAAATNDKVTAKRVRELAPKGYVSKSDLDKALAAERSSSAAVQAAQANMQTARINLSYASVTSPIDGRAGQQQVTEGALVGNGEATLLTTVDQVDPLYVNFTMSVQALEQMRQAQSAGDVTLSKPDQASVRIKLPDGSIYNEPGVMSFSDTTVNPATGAVDLRATIPNPDRTLLPGMYVTLQANLGEQHGVFLVPQQAVQRDTTSAFVMTVGADNKAVRKNVTTTDMTRDSWVVSDGIKAGDQIVVSGIQNVKEGEPVTPSPWQKPGSAKPAAAAAQPDPRAQ